MLNSSPHRSPHEARLTDSLDVSNGPTDNPKVQNMLKKCWSMSNTLVKTVKLWTRLPCHLHHPDRFLFDIHRKARGCFNMHLAYRNLANLLGVRSEPFPGVGTALASVYNQRNCWRIWWLLSHTQTRDKAKPVEVCRAWQRALCLSGRRLLNLGEEKNSQDKWKHCCW